MDGRCFKRENLVLKMSIHICYFLLGQSFGPEMILNKTQSLLGWTLGGDVLSQARMNVRIWFLALASGADAPT